MTQKKISIIIKLQVEGIHNFPKAEELYPEVSFLKYPHRHTFHISCEFEVTHTERDKEFIITKHEINHYLTSKYFDINLYCLNFGGMSCESIALDLFERFEMRECLVGEDGEFESKVSTKDSTKDFQTIIFGK